MSDTEVTEIDFRMPEFRNAKPEDYERRDDGKIVRKDRWQNGMYRIAGVIGLSSRAGFEIEDVITKIEAIAERVPLDEDWLGGIDVERMTTALSWLGHATCGQEEMAARMPEYVNRLTQAVVDNMTFLQETRAAASPSIAPTPTKEIS